MNYLMETWQHWSTAEQAFAAIGLISNILFVLFLAVSHFTDTDTDGHSELMADSALPILSVRGILAFGMFMGWTALVGLRNGLSTPAAAALGAGAGWLAAWLVWRLLRWMLTWQSSGTLLPQKALGKTGIVYLPIPAAGLGTGKVNIELQGSWREMDARSSQEAIATGAPVMVVDYDTQLQILVVAPVTTLNELH